ncbi:hypothetical protein [Nonomuraea sp. NPDC049400]
MTELSCRQLLVAGDAALVPTSLGAKIASLLRLPTAADPRLANVTRAS